MPSDTPVTQVLQMINNGLTNEEITRDLEAKGYNLQQISNAINQANIKKGVEGNMPPQNMQQSAMDAEIPLPPQTQNYEQQANAPPVVDAAPVQPQSYTIPQQQGYLPAQSGPSYEDMQALVEQIVEEKWTEMMQGFGNIHVFKTRVSDDIEGIKQEVVRTQRRLEELQVAVLGKVKDYNVAVQDVSSEMRALGKVFEKIIEPLSMNVKELGRITEDLKK
jgi:hypothetical protein